MTELKRQSGWWHWLGHWAHIQQRPRILSVLVWVPAQLLLRQDWLLSIWLTKHLTQTVQEQGMEEGLCQAKPIWAPEPRKGKGKSHPLSPGRKGWYSCQISRNLSDHSYLWVGSLWFKMHFLLFTFIQWADMNLYLKHRYFTPFWYISLMQQRE